MCLINPHRYKKDGFIQYGLYDKLAFEAKIADGYIPVANAGDFDNLRNPILQEMGVGSPFAGNYTTGVDKKYIQYIGVDLSTYANWTHYGLWNGNFDGNEIATIGLTSFGVVYPSMFGTIQAGGNVVNMILFGDIGNGSETVVGGFCGPNFGIIDNCVFNGMLNGIGGIGGIAGATQIASQIKNCTTNITITATGNSVGGIAGGAIGLIDNCSSGGIITSSANNAGGIVGACLNSNAINISNCQSSCNVTGSRFVGGILGGASSSATNLLINNCSASGTIVGTDLITSNAGGAIGEFRAGNALDCYATGNVIGAAGRSAGFISDLYAGATATNCYSTGNVSGATTNGGFSAFNAGTALNCYWDTVASGNPTSAGGTGKTTAEMKAGVPGVGIYTDWLTPPWDFGTVNDYPILF